MFRNARTRSRTLRAGALLLKGLPLLLMACAFSGCCSAEIHGSTANARHACAAEYSDGGGSANERAYEEAISLLAHTDLIVRERAIRVLLDAGGAAFPTVERMLSRSAESQCQVVLAQVARVLDPRVSGPMEVLQDFINSLSVPNPTALYAFLSEATTAKVLGADERELFETRRKHAIATRSSIAKSLYGMTLQEFDQSTFAQAQAASLRKAFLSEFWAPFWDHAKQGRVRLLLGGAVIEIGVTANRTDLYLLLSLVREDGGWKLDLPDANQVTHSSAMPSGVQTDQK